MRDDLGCRCYMEPGICCEDEGAVKKGISQKDYPSLDKAFVVYCVNNPLFSQTLGFKRERQQTSG